MRLLTRYSMYRQIEEVLPGLISGLEGMRYLLDETRCEVTDASYPEAAPMKMCLNVPGELLLAVSGGSRGLHGCELVTPRGRSI